MKQKIKFGIYEIALISIITSCTTTQNQAASSTPTASPSNTPIIAVTETLSPTNTPEVKTKILDESISPNGVWNAIVSLTTTETTEDLLFVVSNKSTNQKWIVEQVNLRESTTPYPIFFYPYIFKWSQDKNFLYFSYLWDKNDGCFGYFPPGGFGLKRLELSTGEIVVIREDSATWMSFSPNEKQLAYIDDFDGNVSIYDVESGKEQIYPLPPIDDLGMFPATSDLYWSPDGNSLIYTYYVGPCDLLTPFSYIIQLFPDSRQQIILVNHSDSRLVPVEWIIQDKILLDDSENKLWWLNLSTQEIMPAD